MVQWFSPKNHKYQDMCLSREKKKKTLSSPMNLSKYFLNNFKYSAYIIYGIVWDSNNF